MQALICALIILIAVIYLGNRWLPFQFKQRLLQLFGKTLPQKNTGGACGSCSSCGNCGIKKTNSANSEKLTKL